MTRFAVERRAGGDPLTASMIHRLPVGGLLEQLIAYLSWGAELFQSGHDHPGIVHDMPTDAEREATGRRAVTSQRGRPVGDEELRAVVAIYESDKFGYREKVRDRLNLSTRTASRWIALAKDRGLIEDEPTKEDQ